MAISISDHVISDHVIIICGIEGTVGRTSITMGRSPFQDDRMFYVADIEFAFDVVEMRVTESDPNLGDMYYNM